jgi:hypothetical protein
MANIRKVHTVPAPEWWKHLKRVKRLFWKRQGRADKMRLRRER